MISSLHSTPLIKFWVGEFRRAEKKIFGHGNVAIPYQVTSDRSMVFIQSALSEFNSENLNTFRSRAYRIVSGGAEDNDFQGTFPHACLSHVMGSFRKLSLEYYKSNFEFGMFMFSVLLNSSTLADIEERLHAVYYVLLSRFLDSKCLHFLDLLQVKMSNISTDIDELNNMCTDSLYIGDHSNMQLFEENENPDFLTEEDFAIRSSSNEFSSLGAKVLLKVREELQESNGSNCPENKRYSSTMQEKLHKLFIPTIPIWSNILLGDLSRHGTSKVYSSFTARDSIERGNTRIEKRFQILKDIELEGRTIKRLDELSVRLKNHITAVQELAVLKYIKTTRKGRSARTIEETWDKKKPSKKQNQLVGKYQTGATQEKLKVFVKKSTTGSRSTVSLPKVEKTDGNQNNENKKEAGSKVPDDPKTVLFMEDVRLSNTKLTLSNSVYLNEIYSRKILEQNNVNYLQEVHTSITGLENLGNSCWFNSVVQLYRHSKFMRNVNEQFNTSLSYEENLRSVLDVFDKVGKGMEVKTYDIQLALNDLHTIYGLNSTQQNDAHEFVVTAMEHFMHQFGEDCLLKVFLF